MHGTSLLVVTDVSGTCIHFVFDLRKGFRVRPGRRWALCVADVPYYLFRRLFHNQTPELQRNLITNPGCGQNLALSQKKKKKKGI